MQRRLQPLPDGWPSILSPARCRMWGRSLLWVAISTALLSACGPTNAASPKDCVSTTCEAEGRQCGTIPDGCGGEVACGPPCAATQHATCDPTTCEEALADCGNVDDGC